MTCDLLGLTADRWVVLNARGELASHHATETEAREAAAPGQAPVVFARVRLAQNGNVRWWRECNPATGRAVCAVCGHDIERLGRWFHCNEGSGPFGGHRHEASPAIYAAADRVPKGGCS